MMDNKEKKKKKLWKKTPGSQKGLLFFKRKGTFFFKKYINQKEIKKIKTNLHSQYNARKQKSTVNVHVRETVKTMQKKPAIVEFSINIEGNDDHNFSNLNNRYEGKLE